MDMAEFWKDIEAVKELIRMVSDAKIDFVWEKDDGCKIKIKAGANKQPVTSVQPVQVPVLAGQAQQVEVIPVTSQGTAAESIAMVQPADTKEQSVVDDENVQIVTSPLVGTFYSAASPDDEPFVKVGDKVVKGQKLGIIEAMKLMNDIESDFDGEIVEILVSNESMVEYGQPLFKIR